MTESLTDYQIWIPTTLEGLLTPNSPAASEMFVVDVTDESTVDSFTGEHAFLDNSYLVPNALAQDATAEHLYQSFKTEILEERLLVLSGRTAEEAREFGSQVTLHADWDQHRLAAMAAVLAAKFGNKDLRAQLAHTGTALLVHGNDWCDTFWGMCSCPVHRDAAGLTDHPSTATAMGENMLGTLLMQLRDSILRQGTMNTTHKAMARIQVLVERLEARSAKDKAGLAGE